MNLYLKANHNILVNLQYNIVMRTPTKKGLTIHMSCCESNCVTTEKENIAKYSHGYSQKFYINHQAPDSFY
jgi:hypothetical protein